MEHSLNCSRIPLLGSVPRPPSYTENIAVQVKQPQLKGNYLSRRLTRRKALIKRKRFLIGIEFFLCTIGIILVIIETFLYDNDHDHKTSLSSLLVKSFVSASTFLLLCALCYNYYTTIQIRILVQKLASWDLALDYGIVCRFITEMLVCTVHPFPGSFIYITYRTDSGDLKYIHIDAILSVVMMLRLYVFVKFAIIYFSSLTNTSLLSFSALSQVRINARFVCKIVLTTNPTFVITCVMVFMLLALTWSMRTCEIYFGYPDSTNNFFDAMWIVTVTFLTIGYGDIVPVSYCGRFVSVCAGIMGTGTTALLIAVIAKKLEQSRSQKYVFDFMSRMSIERQRKAAAADIIKTVFKTHLLKQKGDTTEGRTIRRQRDKLNQAAKRMKRAEQELERISVTSVGIIEVSEQINNVAKSVSKLNSSRKAQSKQLSDFDVRLKTIETAVLDIKQMLCNKTQ